MRLFCIHCEAKEVSAGPDYLNVNYQNIGQVHIRVHLEKKKEVISLSLGPVLNYFFAAGYHGASLLFLDDGLGSTFPA
jgi:hypothetical protein